MTNGVMVILLCLHLHRHIVGGMTGGAAVLALLEKHGISLAYAALQIGTVQLRRHRRRSLKNHI